MTTNLSFPLLSPSFFSLFLSPSLQRGDLSTYLPISPHISTYLGLDLQRGETSLPISPHISLYLPISPHISDSIFNEAISPHISTYLHISPHISDSIFNEARHLSTYLPTSPRIRLANLSPGDASLEEGARRLAEARCSRDHQRSSEIIRDHLRSPEITRDHPRSPEARRLAEARSAAPSATLGGGRLREITRECVRL